MKVDVRSAQNVRRRIGRTFPARRLALWFSVHEHDVVGVVVPREIRDGKDVAELQVGHGEQHGVD
jgi:hypothetical protein